MFDNAFQYVICKYTRKACCTTAAFVGGNCSGFKPLQDLEDTCKIDLS